MRQKSTRANAVRAGLLAIVLLGGLAVPQSSGAAQSCFACIGTPVSKTTSTCGDPLTEDVVGTGINITGEMIATAVADLGILRGAAITFATTPGTFYQQVFATVTSCNGFNGAVFTLDDLVISGPSGSDGQPVNISFNIAVSGTLTAGASPDTGMGSEAVFNVSSPFFFVGELHTSSSGFFSATGILSSIAGPGAIDTVVTTPSETVVVGTPFSFSLSMAAASFAGCYDFGCSAGDSMGSSDFAQTVGFPCTTQVANLPDGFTLNSVSGLIVDNQFQGCPVPTIGSSGTSPASGH